MKIRSITYFSSAKDPLEWTSLRRAGDFLAKAQSALQSEGYEVQTLRLATRPFPTLLGESRLSELPELARQLDLLIPQIGIGYASLGPALPRSPRSYGVIPDAIAASRNIFFGGLMTSARSGIDMHAVRSNAAVITRCAPLDANGFANLRFAALANVGPGSPFLPAAYHEGARPAFALATEAADLAVEAFSMARSVDEGRRELIHEMEKHGRVLARIGKALVASTRSSRSKASGAQFAGIDFSLAPFPAEASSLGAAMERLGAARAGMHGSLAAAAILTECIDRARFPRVGFSGLMLPVLEDATLSARAAQRVLTVKDLLLYSAVCGTGLDTVPLPGDTTAVQIAPLLLDLAALALRLNKPLTARLMPIPNKSAGDPTDFDFGYFANSRVMALDSGALTGTLSHTESFTLRSR